jgi:hypothetical protein
MGASRGDHDGIPRASRRVALPRVNASIKDEGRVANEAMTHKLKRNSLQRRARTYGFELRHSAYGYSLIDSTRNRVEGRNDLTLDEVESFLARRA